jgi:protein-tyrosine phosphatase
MTSNKVARTDSTVFVDGIRQEATIFDLNRSGLDLRVFISPSPNQSSIEHFVEFMIEEKISDVFNFCHPDRDSTTYDCEAINSRGISVHNFDMSDGMAPSSEILEQFDGVIDDVICKARETGENGVILFHCQAGLGRAPVMLAYLMMSRFGWRKKRIDLITEIRSKRRNTLNHQQLQWIQNAKIKNINTVRSDQSCGCIIV